METFAIEPEDADPLVRSTLAGAGWSAVGAGEDWTLLWSLGEPPAATYARLRPGRFVNHLPGIAALVRKDRLAATLARVEEPLAPETFLFPRELGRFRARAHAEPDAVWIQKPKAGARGEGVSVLRSPDDAETGGNWLVQRYLDAPHLIDGRKYTLRRYVLIVSLEPLVAWIYGDGFTKLASRPFSTAGAARVDRFRHLTNPDVLAGSDEVATSADNLTRAGYEAVLRAEGHDAGELARRIDRLLALAVGAARDELARATWRATNAPDGCFELIGADVLVDSELRPWLLECNLNPSLAVEADGPDDGRAVREERELKQALVRDLFGALELLPGGPGGFTRLDPLVPLPRPGEGEPRPLVPAARVSELPLGDSLVVHDAAAERAYVLDSVAAYAWAAWREGLAPAQIAAELAESLPESAWRAETDVRNALAEWHELGLAVAGDAPAPNRPAPLPRVRWNRERAFRVGSRVAVVLVPNDEIERWLDLSLGGLADDDAETVDLRVEIVRAAHGWEVVAAGERLVCHTERQLGSVVRGLILRRLGDDAFAATLLDDLLLVGATSLRADLAKAWTADGGSCLGDGLVRFAEGEVEGAFVGLESTVGTTWWGELPGLEAAEPLLLTEQGAFAHMWSPAPSPGRAAPRAILRVESPAAGSPLLATPLGPDEAFRDLLGASFSGRLGLETARAAVALAASVPAFRVLVPDPTVGRGLLSALP